MLFNRYVSTAWESSFSWSFLYKSQPTHHRILKSDSKNIPLPPSTQRFVSSVVSCSKLTEVALSLVESAAQWGIRGGGAAISSLHLKPLIRVK